MDARLAEGLLRLAELMKGEAEPWWIIGSAALVLCGIEDIVPDDIDVVADQDTLRRLLAKAGVAEKPTAAHTQFRSSPYGRIEVDGGTDIEVQGDLELWENEAWTPLTFASRIEVAAGSATVFVPSLDEQAAILRRFGRPKDLAKAGMIDARFARSDRPSDS